MKNNYYNYILLFLLIAFSIFHYKNKKKIFLLEKNNVSINSKYKNEKSINDIRNFNLKTIYLNNGLSISDTIKVTNEKGDILLLKDIIKSTKLIFRYSELNCDVCVDKQFEALNKYIDIYGSENILILSQYNKLRNLNIFKRINNIKLSVFNLATIISNMEIEKAGLPYFFIIDSHLTTKDFFIPIKEIDNYTHSFLEKIHSKYFSN